MSRITEKKKEKWINRLDNIKDRVNRVYGEVSECGIPDTVIDSLANMTCELDQAMAEVERL